MSTVAFEAAVERPRAHRKPARLWWTIHQWAGLKISILLSFVLLTGTLAVLSSEMDWLIRPAVRVSPATVNGPVNWPAIARAAAARPGYDIVSIDAPIAGAFAASVTVKKPNGRTAFLYAHPTTGAIQGEGHWIGAKRVLRNMHRHLNMPVWIGVPIVSSLAVLLLISLVSSLIVYKKWWRGFLRPIRTRDARSAWGDFHRLAGVWSLWFMVLIILTGFWYFAEQTLARAPPFEKAEVPATRLSTEGIAARLAASLAAARAADPALRIERIQFPNKKLGTFQFQGQKHALLVRPRANSVWTSVEQGKALLVTDARNLSVHQRISEMADPLHFGTFGGYWTKLPWFLFVLLLTALSVSGVALYSLRLLKAARVSPAARPALLHAWAGMGHCRWPALALVLAGFVLIPTLFAGGGD